MGPQPPLVLKRVQRNLKCAEPRYPAQFSFSTASLLPTDLFPFPVFLTYLLCRGLHSFHSALVLTWLQKDLISAGQSLLLVNRPISPWLVAILGAVKLEALFSWNPWGIWETVLLTWEHGNQTVLWMGSFVSPSSSMYATKRLLQTNPALLRNVLGSWNVACSATAGDSLAGRSIGPLLPFTDRSSHYGSWFAFLILVIIFLWVPVEISLSRKHLGKMPRKVDQNLQGLVYCPDVLKMTSEIVCCVWWGLRAGRLCLCLFYSSN